MAPEMYQDPRAGTARVDEQVTSGRRIAPIPRDDNTFGDLVRWGPILAGVFTAMAVTAVLTILGLAVGFSSLDPGDTASSFGIGAGIWSAATALIAFFIGGWIAARTAAVQVESNGLLQGSMVWMVTVSLLLYFVAGGVGSLFRAAGSAVSTGVQAVAPEAVDQAAQRAQQPPAPGAPGTREQLERAGEEASRAVQGAIDSVRRQVTPGRVQDVAETGGRAAWGTLLSLLLGLGAAALGGYLGNRETKVLSNREERTTSVAAGTVPDYH